MGSQGDLESGCAFIGKDNCGDGTEDCNHQDRQSRSVKAMGSLARFWRGSALNPVPHVQTSVVPGQLFIMIYLICWLFILIPEYYRIDRSIDILIVPAVI